MLDRRPAPFSNAREYEEYLDNDVPQPAGFRFFLQKLRFHPAERPGSDPLPMNISCILSEPQQTAAALVTTTNRFPGASILLARERIAAGRIRGIVVNNKVANVGVASGLDDARRIANEAARVFSVPPGEVLSVSTGVIGWRLPVETMVQVLPQLPGSPGTARTLAQAIMTTDRYPKMAGNRVGAGASILGVAKGAGMIEPNLATMLAFFMTDARVSPEVLDRVLRRVVDRSFNSLSVDSDQSTSDIVLALANGAGGGTVDEADLERAWQPVADGLALEIVRNGEGTSHVIEVVLRGCPRRDLARNLARHVVNSPLVKTAVHGNDPNVGRILAALGDALSTYDGRGELDPATVELSCAGHVLYRDGTFRLDRHTEDGLVRVFADAAMDPVLEGYPQDRGTVEIVIDFHGSDAEDVRVLGSDLSHEYIRVNADYRT
jgi:glutamate N-acetyltransferase / amino-acid N-acetyltransferase